MVHEPIRATDRIIVAEPGEQLVLVERGGKTKLVDRFARVPGLEKCDRCWRRVPGVRDRTGAGHMLCWRCAEVMLDFWKLHTGAAVRWDMHRRAVEAFEYVSLKDRHWKWKLMRWIRMRQYGVSVWRQLIDSRFIAYLKTYPAGKEDLCTESVT